MIMQLAMLEIALRSAAVDWTSLPSLPTNRPPPAFSQNRRLANTFDSAT